MPVWQKHLGDYFSDHAHILSGRSGCSGFSYLYFSTVHTQIEGRFKFEDDPGKTNNPFCRTARSGKGLRRNLDDWGRSVDAKELARNSNWVLPESNLHLSSLLVRDESGFSLYQAVHLFQLRNNGLHLLREPAVGGVVVVAAAGLSLAVAVEECPVCW